MVLMNYLCCTLFIIMKSVMKAHQYLDENPTKIPMQGLVLSRLDCCNSLLTDFLEYQLDKLHCIQNIAYHFQTMKKGSHIKLLDGTALA